MVIIKTHIVSISIYTVQRLPNVGLMNEWMEEFHPPEVHIRLTSDAAFPHNLSFCNPLQSSYSSNTISPFEPFEPGNEMHR